ncbi:MAG: hypothetical protein RL385_765 [Pseudomonadota bacterium]
MRPGLCVALRIQLAGTADVVCVRGPQSATEQGQVAHVAEVTAQMGARLGAFVVPHVAQGSVQLVLVAGRTDTALVAFEPVQSRPDPDVDRSLALKIAVALEELPQAQAAAAPHLAPPLLLALAPPRSAPRAVRWALLLEAGAGLSIEGAPSALGLAGAGARRESAGFALEALLDVRLLATRHAAAESGQVDLRRQGASLALRGLVPAARRLALGASVAAGLVRLAASGVSTRGESGRGNADVLSLRLGAEARLQLFSTAYLGFSPGVLWYPVAQSFAVDEARILRLGHGSFELPFLVGVRTP